MRHIAAQQFAKHSPYFDRIESYCLMHGYVIAAPTFYLMAMPCQATDNIDDILDINRHHCRMTNDHDCVHIWSAAGNMRSMIPHLAAYPHIRFISFQRFGRTGKHHIIPTYGLKTKIATSPAASHGE